MTSSKNRVKHLSEQLTDCQAKLKELNKKEMDELKTYLCEIDKKGTLINKISALAKELYDEELLWSVDKNKIISVTNQGRGPKKYRPQLCAEGYVINTYHNKWGTQKLVFIDMWGKQHYANVSQVSVIDPDPDLKEWENILNENKRKHGVPIIVTVKSKTSRAILLIATKGDEFWMPLSQIVDCDEIKNGETISLTIPTWIAKKNNLISSCD